jgi:predicted nucleic acid-binding protein
VIYWDSSALIKLYVSEPDSGYFLNLAQTQTAQIGSSSILGVEVLCTLWRKEETGDLKHGAASAAYQELSRDITSGLVLLVPFGPTIVAGVERLVTTTRRAKPRHVLRSLDLIHLASALEAQAEVLVATDARLREISTRAGLKVLP